MERPYYQQKVQEQLEVHPACAIIGPRQAGKTTLAHMLADDCALSRPNI